MALHRCTRHITLLRFHRQLPCDDLVRRYLWCRALSSI
ncbi:hypothetical protein AZE42_11769, partial [Rhizopogon vesiculosus]